MGVFDMRVELVFLVDSQKIFIFLQLYFVFLINEVYDIVDL